MLKGRDQEKEEAGSVESQISRGKRQGKMLSSYSPNCKPFRRLHFLSPHSTVRSCFSFSVGVRVQSPRRNARHGKTFQPGAGQGGVSKLGQSLCPRGLPFLGTGMSPRLGRAED